MDQFMSWWLMHHRWSMSWWLMPKLMPHELVHEIVKHLVHEIVQHHRSTSGAHARELNEQEKSSCTSSCTNNCCTRNVGKQLLHQKCWCNSTARELHQTTSSKSKSSQRSRTKIEGEGARALAHKD